MLPEVPELPSIKTVEATFAAMPKKPAMAPIGSEFTMSGSRRQEAEEYAAAMGQAFAINRAQNKHQKAKAKARSRQAQAAAEKRKRR